MHRLAWILLCALWMLLMPYAVLAENWPQWRGPFFNGSTTETGLPEDLSNCRLWTAELGGAGNSTPVVFGDRVFITAVENKTSKLLALCYDRRDGRLLWRREVGIGPQQNQRNNMATPSAVTDGRMAVFYFGTGDLAAFDMDGKPLWARNIAADHGKFNILWLYGSSALLHEGRLYIPVLHRDIDAGQWRDPRPGEPTSPSYLLAVDAASGKDVFKHIRPTDAKVESKESYCTPIPAQIAGRTQILLVGGDCVSAHDPRTGAEYWRCGGWNPQKINHWRIVPSVVAAGELLIACAPKRGPVLAIRGDGSGDVTATHIAWQTREATSDAPTPLYYRDHLYVLDGDFRKGITCIDPATGRTKWFAAINSKPVLRSSPTGADGRIYTMNEAGDVFIMSADDGRLLSTCCLGSEGLARGTVVAAQGTLLIRTATRLHAFAVKRPVRTP